MLGGDSEELGALLELPELDVPLVPRLAVSVLVLRHRRLELVHALEVQLDLEQQLGALDVHEQL